MLLNEVKKKEYEKRDKKIAYLYLKEGLTLREIGQIYGITRERVRQIVNKFRPVEK